MNWPRDTDSASFLTVEVEAALKDGYDICSDIVALGKLAFVVDPENWTA
jgi:hypothetical protein